MNPPAAWDRFAHWGAKPARLALLGLLIVLVASALVPIKALEGAVRPRGMFENITNDTPQAGRRFDDLELYRRVVARIEKGEHYYRFIAQEHRAAHYPVTPGLAVRLPTLAYADAWLGPLGQMAAALVLTLATAIAWWRRLGEEPGAEGSRRRIAFALLLFGLSLGLARDFFVLHELWAGMLLALALGLHRPGKWAAALTVAAMALAIRELALPFVLLMAAMAGWRRDWKEAAAWSALALAFAALLAVHLQIVSAQVLPSDREGADWLVLRGLSGWLSNVVLSSNLRFLPHALAGPLVILAVLGWAGWRSSLGTFAALLHLGYGLAFMIAGRPDNYYWGFMVAPALIMGLAFAPAALKSLFASARAK